MNFRLRLAVLFLSFCWLLPVRAADPVPKPPHIFFLIGEPEYDTKTTVPAFARAELEPRGVKCTFSILPADDSNDFPNIDALKDADLLFISVRRHTPTQAAMEAIRAHIAAGKPVVGIRTASHAFALRAKDAKAPEGYADWPEFDHEILGGNYHDHYGHGLETWGKIVPAQMQHPVLAGISSEEFKVPSHLYKNPDLPAWVTPLMTARIAGQPQVEPIAWVNTKDKRRVFYTSLGAPEDFEIPQFRKLLLNGIFWALGRAVPVPGPRVGEKLRPGQMTAAASTPAEAMQTFKVADDLALEQLLTEPCRWRCPCARATPARSTRRQNHRRRKSTRPNAVGIHHDLR